MIGRLRHGSERCAGTETVRDDGGFVAICKQIERLGNLNKFAPSRFWIGLPTHLRVAHAGEIERDNVIVFGEEWGDEGKAARVGEKAIGIRDRTPEYSAPLGE